MRACRLRGDDGHQGARQTQLPDDAAELPDTITYDMWLDDEDQIRKVTFSVAGVKADMTMSKYGEPVDITAPAAADTVKAPTSDAPHLTNG